MGFDNKMRVFQFLCFFLFFLADPLFDAKISRTTGRQIYVDHFAAGGRQDEAGFVVVVLVRFACRVAAHHHAKRPQRVRCP